MLIINTTPHPITMQNQAGRVYTVEPCGVLVNARPVEEPAGIHPSGAELVLHSVRCRPGERRGPLSAGGRESRRYHRRQHYCCPSIPGRVLAMVPAPGFERVPPAEKRMRDDKFTTF